MRLEVAVGNAGAIALYKKLGFTQFGMYTDYYDDHTDALRMQKVLVRVSQLSQRFIRGTNRRLILPAVRQH